MSDQSIFDIVNSTLDVEREIAKAQGELTPELELLLKVEENALIGKTDNYGALLETLEMSLSRWQHRKEQIDKMIKAHKTAIERLENNLTYAMKALQKNKINGDQYAFTLKRSNGAVKIENESLIPNDFKIAETTIKIDKKSILELLRKGIPVEGVSLEYSEKANLTNPDVIKKELK